MSLISKEIELQWISTDKEKKKNMLEKEYFKRIVGTL